ncbi:hypothetical protein WN55_09299 [Dufourea novaeangliae]|uniref:Uncharacterized protein n=1 Tax=Dufourea novaeangliae TaxID=178035 RepID=A0A154P901_DUFNO|nr:hypothetical protein WN55_09299 [Dufourea novaeangliae]
MDRYQDRPTEFCAKEFLLLARKWLAFQSSYLALQPRINPLPNSNIVKPEGYTRNIHEERGWYRFPLVDRSWDSFEALYLAMGKGPALRVKDRGSSFQCSASKQCKALAGRASSIQQLLGRQVVHGRCWSSNESSSARHLLIEQVVYSSYYISIAGQASSTGQLLTRQVVQKPEKDPFDWDRRNPPEDDPNIRRFAQLKRLYCTTSETIGFTVVPADGDLFSCLEKPENDRFDWDRRYPPEDDPNIRRFAQLKRLYCTTSETIGFTVVSADGDLSSCLEKPDDLFSCPEKPEKDRFDRDRTYPPEDNPPGNKFGFGWVRRSGEIGWSRGSFPADPRSVDLLPRVSFDRID